MDFSTSAHACLITAGSPVTRLNITGTASRPTSLASSGTRTSIRPHSREAHLQTARVSVVSTDPLIEPLGVAHIQNLIRTKFASLTHARLAAG